MGFVALIISFVYLAIFCCIGYFLIKTAVKHAIKEAYAELKAEGRFVEIPAGMSRND